MDPRPGTVDPLADASAELDELSDKSASEQIAAFGRIHTGLAAALAGTVADTSVRPPGN